MIGASDDVVKSLTDDVVKLYSKKEWVNTSVLHATQVRKKHALFHLLGIIGCPRMLDSSEGGKALGLIYHFVNFRITSVLIVIHMISHTSI